MACWLSRQTKTGISFMGAKVKRNNCPENHCFRGFFRNSSHHYFEPMKLFVAKLNREANDSDLKAWFETIGPVKSVKVVMDRETGQSKCFGFVEMERREDGQRAIAELDGKPMMDFRIVIKEAEDRPRSGAGGDRSRGSSFHRTDGAAPRSGHENSAPLGASPGRAFSGSDNRAVGASSGPQFGEDSKPKKMVKKKAGKGRPDKYADGPRSVKMKRGGKGGARPQYGDFDDDY